MRDRTRIALAPLAGVVVLAIASAMIMQFAGGLPRRGVAAPPTLERSGARAATARPMPPAVVPDTPTAVAGSRPLTVAQSTATPVVTSLPVTPDATRGTVANSEPITVTVTNNACLIQDYAIDNGARLTLAPGETKTVSSKTGEHSVRVCFPGTGDCADPTTVVWTQAVSVTIQACPSSITVKVTNTDCEPQRYFVDGQLRAPYLVQGADSTFDTNPGYHKVHTCNIETGDCSEDVLVIWADSTETLIAPSGRCDK